MSGTPITMEMTCKWLDLDPEMKEIPYDSRTKSLIDGPTEDPEDNPDGFIPIIELHNARLKKAHLLHEATSDLIQQKWVEGTDLEDIGKFLQSWAPEPYRNKPMPKKNDTSTPWYSTQFPAIGPGRLVELHFLKYRNRRFLRRSGKGLEKPGHNGRFYISKSKSNTS